MVKRIIGAIQIHTYFIVHTSRLANNLDGTLFYLMIVNKTQSSYDHKMFYDYGTGAKQRDIKAQKLASWDF